MQVLDVMGKVAGFALSHPGLKELDLNPVVFRADGAMVVDATIILAEEANHTPR
jgi:hypothetical protein